MRTEEPNLGDIERAAKRISRYIRQTPLLRSDFLSQLANSNVYLKLENLQNTGSYKIRGAANKIEKLKEAKYLERGIITASAGNHAQGVARAAHTCGVAHFTEIVMAVDSKQIKQDRTRRWGVVLTLHGKGFDEANAFARERAARTGKTMIEAFDDYDVIAGQGTVGLEIVRDLPEVTAVVCPVGGGGLISGIAIVGAQHKRRFTTYGVQAAEYASMVHALNIGAPEEVGEFRKTLADGIAVKRAGAKTFSLVNRYVGKEKIVTVWDSHTIVAMARLAHYEHILAEGAGAVAAAAVSEKLLTFGPGDHVVLVVSGGNISWTDFRDAVAPLEE